MDVSFLQDLCDSIRTAARLIDTPCKELHSEAFAEEAKKLVGGLDGVKTIIIKVLLLVIADCFFLKIWMQSVF